MEQEDILFGEMWKELKDKTNAVCFFFPCMWKLKIPTWEETSGQYELERIPDVEAGEPSTGVWLNRISTHCMSVREHHPESC